MLPFKPALVAAACALLAACATPPADRPTPPALAQAFAGAATLAPAAPSDTWWRAFADPQLDALEERALAANLDLAQAGARVAQARAAATLAGAALTPEVDVGASVQRLQDSLDSPVGKLAHGVGAPRRYGVEALGPQASWEIDLFGARRAAAEGARADLQSARLAEQAARLAVAAETADAYLALRGLQAQLALAREQEGVADHLAQLVQQRLAQGLASDRERQRAVAALEGVRATQPPLRAAIAAQCDRIDVLAGRPAGAARVELATPSAQPAAPVPGGSLAPADLLRHRPDIAAAEQRLLASRARTRAALAEYYPQLSLGASLQFVSMGTSSLFHADSVQAGGLLGLRWRLFDFGRIDAEVDGARGREGEALAAWRQAALHATADVETALSRYVEAGAEADALQRELAALQAARGQSQQAYEGGAVALLEVLDTDREVLAVSRQLSAARAEQSRASVAAFRALGQGWNG